MFLLQRLSDGAFYGRWMWTPDPNKARTFTKRFAARQSRGVTFSREFFASIQQCPRGPECQRPQQIGWRRRWKCMHGRERRRAEQVEFNRLYRIVEVKITPVEEVKHD